MTRSLVVLRPEPGNAATVARAGAAGFATLSLPLFEVRGLSWKAPDAGAFDALILTSANALRFGGAGLATLRHLPVLAVGAHTAAAARAAGFDVMATGTGDAREIVALAEAQGIKRALNLTGRDRTLSAGGSVAAAIAVYESAAIPIGRNRLEALVDTVALFHSARAARRLADLLDEAGMDRSTIAVAAFSPGIADAAGAGWAALAIAARPDDAALFDAVRDARLADR